MTQDYTECEFLCKYGTGGCYLGGVLPYGYKTITNQKCKYNLNCFYKQNKKNEYQLKLVNQDNDELENKDELSKKDMAIELAIELVDIPAVPNFIEDRKAIKGLKRFILGHIIDAIVAAFNKVGKFIHKN